MKNHYVVFILSGILLNTLFSTALFSQETLVKNKDRIKYTQDPQTQNVKSIDFMDERTNKVMSTFDLKANNPYRNLKFPKKDRKAVNSAEFNLSSVNKDQLIKEFIPHQKLSKGEKDYIHFTSAIANYSTYVGPKYAAVCYLLNVYGEEGDALAMKSTALVLNQKGETIFKLPDNHLGCYEPVLTDDGKYLAFHYGTINVESSVTYTESPGLQIYEVTTGKLVLNVDSTSLLSMTVLGNKIVEEFHLRGDKYVYHVYDLYKRILYKKAYTFEERSTLKREEVLGLVFSIPGGGEKLDSFEKDFTKQPF